MDLDAEAAALFAGGPAHDAAAAAATIDFSCPQCDADLHLPLELAGKKTSCPACTRIISVPQPTKEQAADWRQKQQAAPSLAKPTEEPAPEGSWGSAKATNVSTEALVEAKVIQKRRKPRTLTQKLMWPVLAGSLLIGGGVGAWVISNRRQEGRELGALQQALDFAESEEAHKVAPAARSALYLATGDFQRGSGKRDAAQRAREQYGKGVNVLNTAREDNERLAALQDLALAQVELGGEASEVEQGVRQKWDEVQKSLGGVLTAVRGEDPSRQGEAKMFVLRAVVRRMIARGQGERAVTLIRQLYGAADADLCEAMAVTGLELLAAGDTERARLAAQKALGPYNVKPPPTGRAPSRPQLRAAVVALAMAVGQPRPEAGKAIGEDVQLFLGEVEGFARQGKWDRAREKARGAQSQFGAVNRFRAEAALAIVAAEAGNGAVEAYNAATDFLAESGRTNDELTWLLLRLTEVGIDASVGPDRLDRVMKAIRDPRMRGRAALLRLRASLKQGTAPTEEAAAEVEESVARLAAWELVARASSRRDTSWAARCLEWDQPRRAFAFAGVALGLQDRNLGK
jgi:hypothetical protein